MWTVVVNAYLQFTIITSQGKSLLPYIFNNCAIHMIVYSKRLCKQYATMFLGQQYC